MRPKKPDALTKSLTWLCTRKDYASMRHATPNPGCMLWEPWSNFPYLFEMRQCMNVEGRWLDAVVERTRDDWLDAVHFEVNVCSLAIVLVIKEYVQFLTHSLAVSIFFEMFFMRTFFPVHPLILLPANVSKMTFFFFLLTYHPPHQIMALQMLMIICLVLMYQMLLMSFKLHHQMLFMQIFLLM
jgi:hypothetical protein